VALRADERPYAVALDDGTTLRARTIVVATGARYRKLENLDGFDRFEGGGIHYAATAMEAGLVEGEEAVVVGGGNSAGQAAVFLSRSASHVHMLVRGESLAASMSDYLVSRIDAVPERITLHRTTEITALHGDRHLEQVTWTNRRTGEAQTRPVAGVFLMLGAAPNTEWLDGAVALDDRGFVLTGAPAPGDTASPQVLATSRPGIFAVGDVRAGSIKRVASAVGDGSVVISSVHQALQRT
jgi:thioredoxin reductase (NADPH)